MHTKISPCRASVIISIAILMLTTMVPCHSGFCDEIHTATRTGNLTKVKALLAAKPSLVNATDDFCPTPLHLAVQNGHKDIVAFLLTYKANVNAKDGDGFTPLHHAAQRTNTDIVELLLSHGADVNAKSFNGSITPLHLAGMAGQKEAAIVLLAHGANVNAKTDGAAAGVTPAMLAETFDHKDIVVFLHQHGGK